MSGWNSKARTFGLTRTKAVKWCWRTWPTAYRAGERDVLEHVRHLLETAGIQSSLGRGGRWLECKACPGDIWEALSGISDGEHQHCSDFYLGRLPQHTRQGVPIV